MQLSNEYYMYFMLYAASHRQLPNTGIKLDNLNTRTPLLHTSQPLRELEAINDRYNPNQDQDIAESSFTETTTAMEHRVRLEENIKLVNGGNKIMVGKGRANLIPCSDVYSVGIIIILVKS